MASYDLGFETETGHVDLTVGSGQVVFIVGKNGSGKSMLLKHYCNRYQLQPYILPQRILTFSYRYRTLTQDELEAVERRKRQLDNLKDTRTDPPCEDRTNASLNWLFSFPYTLRGDAAVSEDERSISITDHDLNKVTKDLNEVLNEMQEGLCIAREGDSLMAKRGSGTSYDITEMSDGERSIIISCLEIFRSAKNSLVVFDEPERHLHRSITSKFLEMMRKLREDLAFVIATHDVDLTLHFPDSKIVIMRHSEQDGPYHGTWNADLISGPKDIPEDFRRDILLHKRHIIFVEGDENSLDKKLYSILFPDASILPHGNCREVADRLARDRALTEFDFATISAIIDRDGKSDDALRRFEESTHVTVLPYYSIESLYLHPKVVKVMCDAESSGTEAAASPNAGYGYYETELLEYVRSNCDNLACNAALQAVQDQAAHASRTLNHDYLEANSFTLPIEGSPQQELAKVKEKIQACLAISDIDGLLKIVPLKKSGLLQKIGEKLDYGKAKDYIAAVNDRIRTDAALRKTVLGWFGNLPETVNRPADPQRFQ